MMKNKRRGFTVVELVIVVAVVAILATVLIPTFSNVLKKADESATLLRAKNLLTELVADYVSQGKETDLVAFIESGNKVYTFGYDAEEGKILTYHGEPQKVGKTVLAGTGIPVLCVMLANTQAVQAENTQNDAFLDTVNALIDSYAQSAAVMPLEVGENDSWRAPAKVEENVKKLGYDTTGIKVVADYDIIAINFEGGAKPETCGHARRTTLPKILPNCMRKGYEECNICLDCGKMLDASGNIMTVRTIIESAENAQHKFYEITDGGKKPTCTEDGCTGAQKCRYCGYINFSGSVIKKLGHAWDAGEVTTSATCTAEGVKTFTCTRCKTTKTEAVPTLAHTPVAVAGKEATCTETGLTEGKKCSVCGTVLVERTEIPAKGHTPVTDAAVAATCSTKGKTEGSHCSVCNAVIEAQEEIPIDPFNHTGFNVWNQRMMELYGLYFEISSTCDDCNKLVSTSNVDYELLNEEELGNTTCKAKVIVKFKSGMFCNFYKVTYISDGKTITETADPEKHEELLLMFWIGMIEIKEDTPADHPHEEDHTCGYPYFDIPQEIQTDMHVYENGVCKTCGAKKP